MSFGRNLFSNVPIEFSVPRRTKIIVVSDYFVSDVSGGAELTLEAILKASPTSAICKLHTSSLTEELVKKNSDKYWIFGNYSLVSQDVLQLFHRNNMKYSIIEFDFKYCRFRSENYHFLNTGKVCNCSITEHGKTVEKFCSGADKTFWMSHKQKELFLERIPSLTNKNHIVQGSCFFPETFDLLKKLRKPKDKRKQITAVLSGGSWIKGVTNTISLLKHKKIPHEQIPNMEYNKFLEKLSEYKSFTLKPLGEDTAPRVVIEASLLGCELNLNENVLIKDDLWFKGQSPESIEEFLRSKPESFWKEINL